MVLGSPPENSVILTSQERVEGRQDMRLLAPLRVLYTLDTSSQYLLARQKRRVQVFQILEDGCTGRAVSNIKSSGDTIRVQRYAKVSLKTCLEVVCTASPELVCDRSRDYSVYVVDPLEFPPSDDSATPTSQSMHSGPALPPCPWGEGVSIGMGLMSWCLAKTTTSISEEEEDVGYVIGKFVRDRGADTLEIVMSLRETTTQTQRQHALSLSSWGLPALGSEVSSPNAPIPSPFPTSPSPISVSNFPRVSHGDDLPEIAESFSSRAHLSSTAKRVTSVDPPPGTRTKKIGRPPGARTHPEKRARQLAIQMHKEKLERLQNIVKMQNGEEYDKTLIIASECQTKVTEDVIARERKLLEELQSRPLIVDVPRYTTQPLPKRAMTLAHIPLVKTAVAPKRKLKGTANAVASGSGTTRNESPVLLVPTESTHVGTKEGCEAELLLSLLSSVLGKVDESSITSASPVACQGNGKGKEKQTLPSVSNALADALLKLLPHLPKPSESPSRRTDAHSSMLDDMPVDNVSYSPVHDDIWQANPDTVKSVHSTIAQPFRTADESFCSDSQRDYQGQRTGTKHVTPSIPKVREDAHPVPGGGWARGRNLVPRPTEASQPESAASNGYLSEINSQNSSHVSIIATPDKENIQPPKSTSGLKRRLSSSKENTVSADKSPNNNKKKRKQEDIANIAKSKATKRTMLGPTETNKATLPPSGPVRSALAALPHDLPSATMSKPDPLLPELVGPALVASSMSPNTRTSTRTVPPKNDGFSTAWTAPNSATSAPRTPPKDTRLLEDDASSRLASSLLHTEVSLPLPPKSSSFCTKSTKSTGLHERPSPSASVDFSLDTGSGQCHVATGWDLPPSSPPPPTSPILPSTDFATEGDQMDWDFAMQLQSELDGEMKKAGTNQVFKDATGINSDSTSTSDGGIYIMDGSADQSPTFAFDVSSDDVFDLGKFEALDERPQLEGGDGVELDINELWNSLGPVIAHAQLDIGLPTQTEPGFYPINNQTPEEEQGAAVDPVKLAEDLKALFGGCVI